MNKFALATCVIIALAVGTIFALREYTDIFNGNDSYASETKKEGVESKTLNLNEKESARVKLLKQQIGENFVGSVDAPVTIIEYASLSCGACMHFHNEIYPALKKKYIDTGKVRFIYRHYPTSASGLAGAKLVNCVKPSSYFGFIKVLFKAQNYWAFSSDYEKRLKEIAKRGDFSGPEFDTCMSNEDNDTKVIEMQKESAEILGVKSTPTIFVNGTKFEGNRSVESVSSFIDARLKAQDNKI